MVRGHLASVDFKFLGPGEFCLKVLKDISDISRAPINRGITETGRCLKKENWINDLNKVNFHKWRHWKLPLMPV